MTERATGRRGRPRSETTRLAILHATNELLQRVSFAALTVEAIAARAGAGKATIYRWWPTKGALVLDAFLEETVPQIGFPDTGSTREDLRQQMGAVIVAMNDTLAGSTLRALVAASQDDPELAALFRERFLAGRRKAAIEVLERGQRRGELRKDVDPGVVIDALYGALYYRLLVSGERTEADYAETQLDLFLPALQHPDWSR